MDLLERRDLHAIDGENLGSVALRLEAEPSIPGADVEQALAGQIIRNGIARVAFLLHRELHVSVDHGAVRKLEAVVPAFGEQVLAEIEAARRFGCGFHLRNLLSLRT